MGVTAELHTAGLAAERLSTEVETTLYRIAQERGYVDGDFWRRYTINGGGPIPQLETETFTAERLRQFSQPTDLQTVPGRLRRDLLIATAGQQVRQCHGEVLAVAGVPPLQPQRDDTGVPRCLVRLRVLEPGDLHGQSSARTRRRRIGNRSIPHRRRT